MSIEELKSIFVSYDFTGVVTGTVVYLLIRYHLLAYLSEKGKNLATKEDIAEITEKIEEVKRQHAELLEGLKTKNKLRIAALNKRLRAHQEAYKLWREINGAIGTPELQEVVAKCDAWWGENCLYLEPEGRAAFLAAFVGARDLEWYKNGQCAAELVPKVQKEIHEAGGILERSVALPNLRELEITQRKG